jgi:cytochrome b
MKQILAQPNRNKTNLMVDSAIFLAFLVAMAPRFSGLVVHEWLGIAFGAAITTHLLLHWQWIVEVTKRFFSKAQWSARINYILNALLFIDVTLIIFSGLMISEVALPLVGIQLAQSGIWRGLHGIVANLFLVLVALHVALHWQWIVNMFKRFVLVPLAPRRAPQLSAGAAQSAQLNQPENGQSAPKRGLT